MPSLPITSSPRASRLPSTPPPAARASVLPRLRTVASQLSELNAVQVDDLAEIPRANWPRLTCSRGAFILHSWLGGRKGRKRHSWIGDHGFFLMKLNDEHLDDGVYWVCKYCYSFFSNKATSSAIIHLSSDHGRSKDGDDDEPGPKRSRTVLDLQRSGARPVILKRTEELFKQHLLTLIVKKNLPFSLVEDETFRSLFSLLNAGLTDELLPSSHNTVRSWLVDLYEAELGKLRELLDTALSNVNLSWDTWTSPNSKGLLAIIAHWIDDDFVFHTRLLALVELQGSHSGENQAAEINSVVTGKFQILWHQLGHFVTDGHVVNGAAVYSLARRNLHAITNAACERVRDSRRLYCHGHNVNLVAKEFISVPGGPIEVVHSIIHHIRWSPQRRSTFLRTAQHQEDVADDDINAINHPGAAPAHEDHSHLLPVADNATRWNSTYNMLRRALKLRNTIEAYVLQFQFAGDGNLRHCIMDEEQWDIIARVNGILRLFSHATKKYEGNGVTLPEVMPCLYVMRSKLRLEFAKYAPPGTFPPGQDAEDDHIVVASQVPQDPTAMAPPPTPSRRSGRATRLPSHLEGHEIEHFSQRSEAESQDRGDGRGPQPPHPEGGLPWDSDGARYLAACLSAALRKLEDVIEKVEVSYTPWFAMILHPGFRGRWLDLNVSVEKKRDIINRFKDEFEDVYQGSEAQPQVIPQVDDEAHEVVIDLTGDENVFFGAQPVGRSEAERYLSEPVVKVDCPLAWWKTHKTQYPKLSAMAVNYLSIPAMSAEAERVFSRAKHTITYQRHAVMAEVMGFIECLRNWLPNVVI